MAGDVHRLARSLRRSSRAGRPAGRPSAPRRSSAPGCRAGPTALAMRVEHALRARPGCATSSGRNRRRLEFARERLDVRPRLLVEVGDRRGRRRVRGTPWRSRRRSSARWRCPRPAPWRPSGRAAGLAGPCVVVPVASGPPAAAAVWRAIISSSLVGITQAATAASRRADARAAARFAAASSSTPSQRRVAADALADRRRVLADAGGEDERVEPAERRRQRAELAPDAIDEEIDRERARAARRSRAARACRSTRRRRRAGPTACRSASRSRARPCRSSSIR